MFLSLSIYIYIYREREIRIYLPWGGGLRRLERFCQIGTSLIRKHKSTRKREYVRIMLPLMSQIWFHVLGWG